jgi:hypothetical protein
MSLVDVIAVLKFRVPLCGVSSIIFFGGGGRKLSVVGSSS